MKNIVRRLVVFSILMENNEGISMKAPSYILEKYNSAMELTTPETLLDKNNRIKFDRWVKTWEK